MYLLLRNNKQSGPYSLEELKSMGLKAYDLVWSEGKSAAWRYPSELEELKSFAPAVEEQPFDRFYRKATPTSITDSPVSVAVESTIPVTVESTKTPGKRIIYVTMPAARNASAASTLRETAQPLRLDPTPPVETVSPIQMGPRVIEDYTAQPIEDQALIGEFFPRKRNSRKMVRLLTIAICILALLAAGVIIGLNLNKATLGFPSRIVAKVPPAGANSPSGNPEQTIVHPIAQPLSTPATTTVPAKTTDTVPNIIAQPAATRPAVAKTSPITPGFKTQKERPSHPGIRTNSSVKDSVAGGSAVANPVHRADVAEPFHNNTELADKEAVKAALASQVSVGANGYSVGTFGGITGLQLTVTNRSAYPLDLVTVEVQYVQANKKVFKTENLYFRGIGAGSALMMEAPKSSRGVRVQYKIMSITSKEVAYSYTGI
jgi:hypothetical protein